MQVNSQSPWKPQRDFETVRRDLEPSRIDSRYVVHLLVIVLAVFAAVVTNLA